MDISPGDSTPTSEVSYGGGGNNSSSQLPTNEPNTTLGPVLLANALPRLISHPIHVPSTPVSLHLFHLPDKTYNDHLGGKIGRLSPKYANLDVDGVLHRDHCERSGTADHQQFGNDGCNLTEDNVTTFGLRYHNALWWCGR